MKSDVISSKRKSPITNRQGRLHAEHLAPIPNDVGCEEKSQDSSDRPLVSSPTERLAITTDSIERCQQPGQTEERRRRTREGCRNTVR